MKEEKVLITGASRGIGRATAIRFAAAGYPLCLLCHAAEQALSALAAELSDQYRIRVLTFAGDVGDPAFAEQVLSETGDVDILINNAGVSYVGLLSAMELSDWDSVIATNLSGAFYFCRGVIPGMVRKKTGRIINVSSIWGSAGASCEAAYSASKGGLDALTKALAKELAPSNIQVNAIACGCIDTEMNATLSAEERRALEEEIPAGRFGTPEEAAELIFSVAHAPAYLTGQIIGLAGGFVL